MTLPWITVLSVARSGTNHVCRLLAQLQGIRVYYEWFDELVAYADADTLAAFEARIGTSFEDFRDPALAAWIRNHVPETLDLLQTSAGPEVSATVIKVFQKHVSNDAVLTRNFFANPSMNFIVIRRRPVDCYISFQKALALSKFIRVDTTDLKPRISARAYIDWHAHTSRWFDTSLASLEHHGRNHLVLDYDSDIAGVDDLALTRRLVRTLRGFGIETRIPVRTTAFWAAAQSLGRVMDITNHEGGTLGLWTQDRSTCTEEKIENWDEFAREIEHRDGDLRRLDSYFMEPRDFRQLSAGQ